jgi:hypothetical protein
LSDAIAVVRDELLAAQAEAEGEGEGEGSELAFKVGSVEMEFEVALEREAKVDGKIRVWVAEFGPSGRIRRRLPVGSLRSPQPTTLTTVIGSPRSAPCEALTPRYAFYFGSPIPRRRSPASTTSSSRRHRGPAQDARGHAGHGRGERRAVCTLPAPPAPGRRPAVQG